MNYNISYIYNIYCIFLYSPLFPPFFSCRHCWMSSIRNENIQHKKQPNEFHNCQFLSMLFLYIYFIHFSSVFFFLHSAINSVWIYVVVDWFSLLDFRRTNNYLWLCCGPMCAISYENQVVESNRNKQQQ